MKLTTVDAKELSNLLRKRKKKVVGSGVVEIS
jgi:hypothetical protein